MNPPKKFLRIRLEDYNPIVGMQILPAAILYKQKVWENSNHTAVVRITLHDGYLSDFLFPYQPGRQSRPDNPVSCAETDVKFPLETCLDRRPIRELADRYFVTDSTQFFEIAGFPPSYLGSLCRTLYLSRPAFRERVAYCVPRMDGDVDAHENSWLEAIDYMDGHGTAAITHYDFVPAEMKDTFKSIFIETNPTEGMIWRIARTLLTSKYYLGGYNIIAQLAIRLQVPAIILTPQRYLKHEKFPVETSDRVVYVRQDEYGKFLLEEYTEALQRLERFFIPKSRPWY